MRSPAPSAGLSSHAFVVVTALTAVTALAALTGCPPAPAGPGAGEGEGEGAAGEGEGEGAAGEGEGAPGEGEGAAGEGEGAAGEGEGEGEGGALCGTGGDLGLAGVSLSTSTSGEDGVAVAHHTTGGALLAWMDATNDNANTQLIERRISVISLDGTLAPVAASSPVSPAVETQPTFPSLAEDVDHDKFLVAWGVGAFGGIDVRGIVVDGTGAPVAASTSLVPGAGTYGTPQVAWKTGVGFLVVYVDAAELFSVIVDETGAITSGPTDVITLPNAATVLGAVIATNGGFLAALDSDVDGNNDTDVIFVPLADSGAAAGSVARLPLPDLQVQPRAALDPSTGLALITLVDNGAVFDGRILGQIVDGSGVAQGNTLIIDDAPVDCTAGAFERGADVVATTAGFAVVWGTNAGGEIALRTRTVGTDGTLGATRELARGLHADAGGVPFATAPDAAGASTIGVCAAPSGSDALLAFTTAL